MNRWTTIWLFITKGYRKRMLISMIGVMISLMFVVGVMDVIKTVEVALIKEMNVEKGTIFARKKSVEVGIFDVSSFLSKPGIPEGMIDEIKALPGIKSAYRETWSRFPVRLSVTIMGRSIGSDATLLGVEVDAVEAENREAFQWSPPKPGEKAKPIPVLAPKMLLTAWNGGFAEANGMPKVASGSVKSLSAQMRVGANSFERLKKSKRMNIRGAGVTTYGNNTLAGIVPIESIYWLNEQLEVEESELVSGLAITLEDDPGKYGSEDQPAMTPEKLSKYLGERGLQTSDSSAVEEMFNAVSRMLFYAMGTISIIMYISGAVILFILYRNQMLERAPSLQTLVKLGVKRDALINVLFWENAIMTILGILMGYSAGRVVASQALPTLQSKIESSFGLAIELPELLHHQHTQVIVVTITVLTIMVNIPNMLGILRRN